MADEALTTTERPADTAAVGRWAAAQARTFRPLPAPVTGSGREPRAAAPVPGAAVLSSFSEIGGWDAGAVSCVAWGWLPDGRSMLATGGDDGAVRIWDDATGLSRNLAINAARSIKSIAWGVAATGPLLAVAGLRGRAQHLLDLGPGDGRNR